MLKIIGKTQLILLVFLLFSVSGQTTELQFLRHGKPIKKLSLSQIKSQLKSAPRRIFEPSMNDLERTYIGVEARELFDFVYGEGWKKEDEILFTCSDGYQPSVPVEEFLNYTSYLVYALEKNAPFVVDSVLQNRRDIPLGPFYLVWDNRRHPELRKEEPSYWPYQVVKMDFVDFKKRFPKLAPKKQSSEKVRRGFNAYRKLCLSCHSIQGSGGKSGGDLAGVVGRKSRDWVYRYMDDPRKINPESKMSRMRPDMKNRKDVLWSVVDYLEHLESR